MASWPGSSSAGAAAPWSCQDRTPAGVNTSSTQLAGRRCGSDAGRHVAPSVQTSVASRSSNVTRLCRVPNWMFRRHFGWPAGIAISRPYCTTMPGTPSASAAVRLHFRRPDDHQLHSGREQNLRPIGGQRDEPSIGVHRIIGRNSHQVWSSAVKARQHMLIGRVLCQGLGGGAGSSTASSSGSSGGSLDRVSCRVVHGVGGLGRPAQMAQRAGSAASSGTAAAAFRHAPPGRPTWAPAPAQPYRTSLAARLAGHWSRVGEAF